MAKEKRPYGTPRIEIRNGYKLAVMIKVAFDIHNYKVDVRAAEAGAKLERIPKGEDV